MPKRLLILGLGNDLLTDDAVGLLIARQLKRRLKDLPDLEVTETTEMGLALLDLMTGYRGVVIIDSIKTGKTPPGVLHELDPAEFAALVGATPHFLGVGETLALGRQLGLAMPEQVRVFGIEVADPFTLSTSLTPELSDALPGLVERIEQSIRKMSAA